jgi:hypothetical protein
MQHQVHRAEACDAVHQFDAEQRPVLEPLFLRLLQAENAGDVIMSLLPCRFYKANPEHFV